MIVLQCIVTVDRENHCKQRIAPHSTTLVLLKGPPPAPYMKLLLQHLLETSLQQQLVTLELAKGLQVTTQELLQQQARASPLPGCLLDP